VDNTTGKISLVEGDAPVIVDAQNDTVKNVYDGKKLKFPIVP